MRRIFKRLVSVWNDPKVQRAWAEFKAYLRSIRASLNDDLFVASPDFWSHHVGGIVVLVALDLALNSILRPSYLWEFHVIASAFWGAGFFFSGLLLRSHYHSAKWESQTQLAVLLKSIASAAFFSFCIVLLMSLVAVNLYFDDLYRYSSSQTPDTSSIGMIARFFFGNWFATSFYLLCWIVLYMGITSRRTTKQMEIDNLRLQNSLKEAELSSLSNQLNPHFLFNALNNIRFMIHEDANNAEKMLMSLSSVLRYSLESSKNMRVALVDELDISRRYIELIQIQFEERLRFEINIPDSLLSCQLPPMVLQMLLENAVKHGIDNIKEGGTIDVAATLEGTMLNLQVCNDLPRDYAAKHKTAQSEPGIGLYNIGQRLDLLYAERGSIETSVVDNRFCVNVKIPQE